MLKNIGIEIYVRIADKFLFEIDNTRIRFTYHHKFAHRQSGFFVFGLDDIQPLSNLVVERRAIIIIKVQHLVVAVVV